MAYSRRAVAQRVGRERARLCCVHALSAGTAACLMRDSCSIEAPSCEPPSVGNSRPGGGRVTSFPPPNQATRCQTTCLEIMTKHFPLFILSRSPSYIVPSKATPKGSPPPPLHGIPRLQKERIQSPPPHAGGVVSRSLHLTNVAFCLARPVRLRGRVTGQGSGPTDATACLPRGL